MVLRSTPAGVQRGPGALLIVRFVLLFFVLAVAPVRVFGATSNPTKADAAPLVAAAAEAEIRGDIKRSDTLLKEAISTDPSNRLAHWRQGEIQVNKKWLAVEEAQQRAAEDRRFAEYDHRRLFATNTLADQLAVAKWCSKHNLVDESRYHWANVLALDLNNVEAQRALDVKWVRGRLMTSAELAAD